MKMVDLSHTMNIHTPGWVGYAGNKMYYAQTLQTNRIVAQRIESSLHAGTHLDGPMHSVDGGGDMASLPLEFIINKGAIVDISDQVGDWDIITPQMLEDAPVEIENGDILIIHTGYHKYWEGEEQQDLVRYFTMHPGGTLELADWMIEREIKWFGVDAGSGDHPMNTTIRDMRPDLRAQFEDRIGMTCEEFFPEYEYTHHLSGRVVKNDMFPFHNYAMQFGLIHSENIGGDIDKVLNQRALIGAFPWKYEGLESCPCRVIAFLETDTNVEEFTGPAMGHGAGS